MVLSFSPRPDCLQTPNSMFMTLLLSMCKDWRFQNIIYGSDQIPPSKPMRLTIRRYG